MPIEQKKTKMVVKDQNKLVRILPETSIDAVDGLASELQTVIHNVGAESIDGVKTFAKNTMTNAIALNDGSTIDVSQGSFFTKTITTDTTFTFTGVPTGKSCIFSLILTNAGAYEVTFPNNINWMGGDVPILHAIGVDCLTFFTVDGGNSWMEVSGTGSSNGGSGGGTIADSGVVAGSYGPATNEVPTYGDSFVVPQFTVNQKGQVTSAINKTITIPASDNTDVKVAVVENSWAKSYLLGADAAAYQISGSPIGVTATADSAIYLGSSPGNLHATTFVGALSGNASSATNATNDSDGNKINTTYAKLNSTNAFVQGPYRTTVEMSASEINLANGSVFTKTITSDTSFTIVGTPSGSAASFNLILVNGGAYTIVWPASVKWAGGNVPTLSASGVDLLSFLTPDGGTTWYGVLLSAAAA